MSRRADRTFDWTFLREIGNWSLGVVMMAAIAGALVADSWRFAVWCIVAGAIDVIIVRWAAAEGGRAALRGEIDRGAMAVFLVGRPAYKVVLMVSAIVWPAVVDFWGVVVGVLAYDTTLLVVGSALAMNRTNAIGR